MTLWPSRDPSCFPLALLVEDHVEHVVLARLPGGAAAAAQGCRGSHRPPVPVPELEERSVHGQDTGAAGLLCSPVPLIL